MGWSSWDSFYCNITETDIMQMADAMATNGMKDAGYQYINIDDCWALYRDAAGVIVADTNSFPSGIKALADYVHSRGLKLGLYTDRGLYTCAGRPGSYGYENLDALTYASWGVDYLKEDGCSPVDDAYSDYTRMSAALTSCGRPVVFSICNGPFEPWMPVLGNLWRTTGDLQGSFAEMVSNLDENSNSAFAAGPGHWNDPDMLVVGLGTMSDTEDQAHFSMWCIVAAPLIAGNNLLNMSQTTKDTLTNPEVIAVDQDPAGVQGILVGSVPGVEGNLEVWCKPLGTDLTTKAVALFNRSSTNASITANWSDIGLQPGNATVRDLWARTDLGTFVNAYSAVVPTHGVKLLKIIGTGIVGQGSGAPSASFTASPITGAAPLTVTFADTSTGTISNWFWSFGDGNSTSATTNSMSYTYVTPGTYSVTEYVAGPGGVGSSMRTNYINLAPSARFTAYPIGGAVPLTVTFADTSIGTISNWFWNFGDGNSTNATTNSMSHTYVTSGTYSITEYVAGPGGVGSSMRTNYITVSPSASFTANPIGGAVPLTVTFADTSTGTISNWFWNFGDGNSTNATIKSMSHTYVTAGTYSVAEIVTGSGGSGSSTRDNYIIALTPLQALQFQAWQSQYFGCTNCQQAQLSMDADGTGQNNWFKYTAGLDPTNPASVFVLQITSVTNQPTQMNLLFNPMVAGRTYTPLISTNPVSGTWANLASFSGPVTNGNQVSITDTNAIEPQKFYRIGISLP
jgi:alpha-galactosidase